MFDLVFARKHVCESVSVLDWMFASLLVLVIEWALEWGFSLGSASRFGWVFVSR